MAPRPQERDRELRPERYATDGPRWRNLPKWWSGVTPPNAGRRYPPEPLTRDEVIALLNACGRGPTGIRNRAIIVVLWRGGLRVGELCALYPRDFDPDAGVIRVRHGKGDKSRPVGLDPQAAAVVQLWLAARAKLGLTGRHPLFCTVDVRTRGRAMRTNGVREMLAYRAKRAGIDKRVHPHGLRHTHAFELSTEGTPLDLIRRQLGHSNVGTTQRYINHLAPADVIAAMQRREWNPTPNGDPTHA